MGCRKERAASINFEAVDHRDYYINVVDTLRVVSELRLESIVGLE